MTTSLRRPRLADKSIGGFVLVASTLMGLEPPDGAVVSDCRCEFRCADPVTNGGRVHPGFWLCNVVPSRRLIYWQYICLFGCTADPDFGNHQR